MVGYSSWWLMSIPFLLSVVFLGISSVSQEWLNNSLRLGLPLLSLIWSGRRESGNFLKLFFSFLRSLSLSLFFFFFSDSSSFLAVPDSYIWIVFGCPYHELDHYICDLFVCFPIHPQTPLCSLLCNQELILLTWVSLMLLPPGWQPGSASERHWWEITGGQKREENYALSFLCSLSQMAFADNGYVSPMAPSPMGNVPSVVPVPTAVPTVSPASALGVLAHRFQ